MCTYVHVLYCALFYWYLLCIVRQISMLFIDSKDYVLCILYCVFGIVYLVFCIRFSVFCILYFWIFSILPEVGVHT